MVWAQFVPVLVNYIYICIFQGGVLFSQNELKFDLEFAHLFYYSLAIAIAIICTINVDILTSWDLARNLSLQEKWRHSIGYSYRLRRDLRDNS